MTIDRAFRSAAALGAARTHMLVITITHGIFALSLILQPARWASTPAYANLLAIMPQQAWGAWFAVVSASLAAAVHQHHRKWLTLTALSLGLAITTTWFGAFVVRWLTSPNTTPETWVSWAVFDYLLIRALLLLGYREVRVPVPPRNGGERG